MLLSDFTHKTGFVPHKPLFRPLCALCAFPLTGKKSSSKSKHESDSHALEDPKTDQNRGCARTEGNLCRMKTPRIALFKAYQKEGFTLIPLHRPDATSQKKGRTYKDGKRPLHFNWTKEKYPYDDVLAHVTKAGLNAGIRLRKNQLVIDVDPRNGGTEGFENLCLELELDTANVPHVITGSGGSHYYFTKPNDWPVVDTLPDFPGVEFKGPGRQVVAAGSVHPETDEFYKFDESRPNINTKVPAPENLLQLIRRPQRSTGKIGGGQYDQEKIARMLATLDPTDFRDHASWFVLMCAVHHASNGDARHEFIEWSTSDPKFADDAEMIGRRWDSLHTDPDAQQITYKTLNKILRDKSPDEGADLIPPHTVSDEEFPDDLEDEFEDEPEFEDGSESEYDFEDGPAKKAKKEKKEKKKKDRVLGSQNKDLLALNEKYSFVTDGAKVRIMYQSYEPTLKRKGWERMLASDFMLKHCNASVFNADRPDHKVPLGKAWVEWPGRNSFEGVVFDPEAEHEGYLNLFTGWGVTPSQHGSWNLLNELISDALCDGNEEVYDYVMNWIRHMFQFGGHPAETAIVFKGEGGVGKGTLGNALATIVGHHAISVGSSEVLVGRFNQHLQDTIFLFGDEAVKPGDKNAESRLKHMITEPRIAFEGKGANIITGKNCLHIMLASNEAWVIPAAPHERRFLMANVNPKWQGNTAKFDALREELYGNDNAGLARFLWDALKTPLPKGWHPRNSIPSTTALMEQKLRNSQPLALFFYNCLTDGMLPFDTYRGDWATDPVRAFHHDFKIEFQSWCRANGISPGAMGRANTNVLLQDLKRIFPAAKERLRDAPPDGSMVPAANDGRAYAFELPPINQCRKMYDTYMDGKVDWGKSTKSDVKSDDEAFD